MCEKRERTLEKKYVLNNVYDWAKRWKETNYFELRVFLRVYIFANDLFWHFSREQIFANDCFWNISLDQTLPFCRILANKLTSKIDEFCVKIGLRHGQAYDLYKQYGTALKGLIAEGYLENTEQPKISRNTTSLSFEFKPMWIYAFCFHFHWHECWIRISYDIDRQNL